ncbi:unnamed protein product [Mycena citricolor]|uniref:Uncharacterized protein n=1 Tax=Mycena citricolor TaxID=2018698 RepID=A0AAD2H4D5_9AGAR|nr:unnamed protein product [Mycena citricolor]CAK5283369.1 unnamed protein product [Mycena citricolor]
MTSYLTSLLRDRYWSYLHCAVLSATGNWGYALTQALDNYNDEIQPIPGLKELRGGEGVIGPDGGYYMGGVNQGDGLDQGLRSKLNQMIDDVEPNVNGDLQNEPSTSDDLFAWFSDEEESLAAAEGDW